MGEQGDLDLLDINIVFIVCYVIGGMELYVDLFYIYCCLISLVQYCVFSVLVLYLSGFVLYICLNFDDVGGMIGMCGMVLGWCWDLSDIFGLNDVQFGVWDIVNGLFGVVSLMCFDVGGVCYIQNVVNVMISCFFDFLVGLNFVFGVEYCYEYYMI